MPNIVYDPQHPCLKDPKHYHFVMQKGIVPVSVTHIELLDSDTAFFRALATDGQYQNKGYGTYLLDFMERWVMQFGKTKMLLHAARRAEHFYRKRGYVDMQINDVGVNPDNIDLGKNLS